MKCKIRFGPLEMVSKKACQIIGIPGFTRYSFVWCYDDVANFGIHEYTTGLFIAFGCTLNQAQKNAEIKLRTHAIKLDEAIRVRDQINDLKDYGFNRD